MKIKKLLCIGVIACFWVPLLQAQPNEAERQRLQQATREDHQHMLQQLGITQLRPGPSGQADAPNPANYDESKADRYPQWPAALTLNNGEQVTDASMWWQQLRPEIVEAFEREVVGRIPNSVPAVSWSVSATEKGVIAGRNVVGRSLQGRVDNSAFPDIAVNIELTLVLPERVLPDKSDKPVPVMIMFRGGTLSQAVGNEEPPRFFGPQGDDVPATEQLIANGWGFAFLNPRSIQEDNGAGLTKGIIGLVNKGQRRKPEDWGALRAWAWGASQALNYFENDALVDAKRVGIEGVSRYGKAALVTMAFDQRFALVLIGSSGEGGASPYRRNFGEMVENITGSGEYHWMAGNFLKYGAEDSTFGRMDANDLPIDSHMLLALCAPRATFVSYGIPEKGDALWLDQQGSYMATVAADKVFELLGAKGLGTSESYQTAKLPPVNLGLLNGMLAWRQHDGGHTDAPNWKYFIPWANQKLGIVNPAANVPWPRTDPNSHIAHQELLEKAKQGTIDLYFEGDSITRRWGALDYPELLANWKQNFHGWNAANFAWGGDQTQNILWRLNNGEFDGLSPKVVVIQAGTNNVGGRAGDEAKIDGITAGIAEIVQVIANRSPQSKLILTGIFPRSEPEVVAEIKAINTNLETLARQRGIHYLNINDRLADGQGILHKEMSSDGLHLSKAGYQVWGDALKPLLTEIMGPPAETDNAPPATGNPAAR